MADLACQHCGTGFDRPNDRGPIPLYCSASCRQRAYEKRLRGELTRYKRLVRGMIDNDDACQSPFCGITMMGHLIIPLDDELVDLVKSQDKDQPEYEGDLDSPSKDGT